MKLFDEETIMVIKGLPGSGKTTLADAIADLADTTYTPAVSIGPDHYPGYYPEGVERTAENYVYTGQTHADAHRWLLNEVDNLTAEKTPLIVVHEVGVSSDFVSNLHELAAARGYNFVVVTTENHHGNESRVDIPDETMLEKERQLRGGMSLLPERLKRRKRGGRPPKLPLETLSNGATVVLESSGYEPWDGDLAEGHSERHARFMAARRAAHKMAKRAGRRIQTEPLEEEGEKNVEITLIGRLD